MFSALSGPVISSAYVDPVKVVPGDTMYISADVQDSSGISFVTARMPYEGGADILNLSLASGTVYDGVWTGDWFVHDTDVKNYTTTITAENILGESSVAEIEWSDPADWDDSAWTYRRPVTINNSGSALTDYQVNLNVSYDSDMQADFDDIRFTSSDGTTLISHWRESYIDSDSAEFWIKVPSISSGTSIIYMYYGNSSAISESNFSSISQGFWINQTGYSATPSIQTPYDFIVESDRALWGGGRYSAGYNGILFNYTNTQDKFTINFTTKFTSFNHPSSFLDRSVYFFDAYTEDNNGIFTMFRRGNTMYVYDGSVPWGYVSLRDTGYSKNIGTMNTDTEYDIGIDFDGTIWRVYVDGTLKRTITQSTYKDSPVGWVRISGRHCTNSYGTTDTVNQITIDSDSFYQNQYVASEPVLSIGGEERDNWQDIWHDSDGNEFLYRKPISISNSGSALTDYQVELTVDTQELISAIKMQLDCDDIRFVYQSGSDYIQMAHWQESGCDTVSTKLWVKVPSIPSGTSTIYMYYGNSSVGSASDGNATFEFFDDFEDEIYADAWEEYSTSGCCKKEAFITAGNAQDYALRLRGYRYIDTCSYKWRSKTTFPVREYVMGVYGKGGSPGGIPVTMYYTLDASSLTFAESSVWLKKEQSVSVSSASNIIMYLSVGGWFCALCDCGEGASTDYIYLRKYATPEPILSIGDEEKAPDTTPPQISFVPPTPDDGETLFENYVNINVTITNQNNTTAFIDWDRSLVGWWRFNNGTDFTDYSTYSNDGTNQGSTYAIDGKFGGARSFDGVDDKVTISGDNRPINTFSFGGWMKTSLPHQIDTESTSGVGGIDGQNYVFGASNEGFNAGVGLSVGTNGISVYEHGSGYMPAIAVYSLSIGSDWNHIVIVYDNKQPTIYLNGMLVHIGLISPKTTLYTPFEIGGGSYGNFSGTIDEVKIWNRALTLDEIKASYNAGLYRLEANFTNLIDGTYTYTAYAYDIFGNINQTETRTVIVDYEDTKSPEITIKSPNPLVYSTSSVWFNVSLNEEGGWCGYSLDGAENVTMNKADARNFYMLDNSMAEAEYTVVFYCNDTFGNMNLTEVRYFEVNFPPYITVESPRSSNIYSTSSIWFNVTLADSDTDWCGYSLNGTANVTMMMDNATHFYYLNETVYKGNHDVVFYCNDSNGFFNNTDKIYFDVQYECLNDLDCPAGAICASHICIFIRCTEYCTNSTDVVCHAECNGTNGCLFYDAMAMSACDGMLYNQWVNYGADKVVKCCEGASYTSYKPDVVYAGLNPFTIDLGEVSDVAVSVRNRNDFEDTFTISLESTSNLRYWSWFSTHKNDEERMSMDVSFKPYEQKFISLRVLGGTVGCFNGIDSLKVNSTSSFGESEVEYIEVCVKPAGAGGLFSRSVPGLSDIAFAVLLFLSVFLYGYLLRKRGKDRK